MTNLEFSNEFDVLYNSITSNQAPGLDEYEKSVFLTKAQDEIIKAYFNPKTNKVQEGFDVSAKRQIDFSTLISNFRAPLNTISNPDGTPSFTPKLGVFDGRDNTEVVELPSDIMMIINEYIDVTRGSRPVRLTVIPINYMEYSRLMSKPYKRPTHNKAWRLIDSSYGRKVELIPGPIDIIKEYVIRYIKRPRAIILDVLSDGTSLDGYVGANKDGKPTENRLEAVQGIECELDPILHPEILQRAVELAKAAYAGGLDSQLALGQTSQTNMGIVTQSR